MPVESFELVGSFNKQRALPIDAERTINMFEYLDPLGKKPHSLIYTSGIQNTGTFFSTLTGGSRAQFVYQGVGEPQPHMYMVLGSDVYRIDLTLSAVLIFSFSTSSGYVGLDGNSHQVIFVDGSQGWIWDTLTNTATRITDPNFPTKPIDVTFLDGFFVVPQGDTNTFFLSSINQGLVWGTYTDTFVGSAALDTLTIAGGTALWATGVPFRVSTTGTLPAPLVAGTTYFAILVSPTAIKVASTFDNAIAGVAIDLTTDGAPTNTISSRTDISGQLQQGAINSHPGNIIGIRTLHRYLFIFSNNFTEVWENKGIGTNLPFRRVNSLLIEYGLAALGSLTTGFDKMFFLANDRDGLGSVMMVTGTTAGAITNEALDFVFAQYAEQDQISDARGFLIKENGLIFYRLNFTTANHTWVYNVTLSDPSNEQGKRWHEEEVLNGNRHRAQTHSYFGGKNYVGDYAKPILYLLDNSILTNNGESIRRARISRSFVPPAYQRLRIDRFQLDLLQGQYIKTDIDFTDIPLLAEDGLTLLTEMGVDILLESNEQAGVITDIPVVFLSVSRDGGQTFGNLYPGNMGAVGQRSFRTLWRKLGTIPRGQGFVAKIEFFNIYPFTVLGASWAVEVLPE